ncbi:MAG TPA: inositol monophosphatase family protein [Solirubrobacterales bacterium]|jgi:fructose-1,6-bisphosphatase/inositol monophosphatase family enzyme
MEAASRSSGFVWDGAAMGAPPAEAEPAIRAVADALGLARARAGAAEVTHKDERDIFTATDVRIEDQIRADLGEALGARVVGEEQGGEAAASGEYWMLDPICGTRNYASGIPLYCVNLALVRDRAPVLSVVGDASIGEILVARAGGGAWALGREGGARRLRAEAASQMLIVEPGKSSGARRDQAADFLAAAVRADRWDPLLAEQHAIPRLRGGRACLRLRRLLRHRGSHDRGRPAGEGGGRRGHRHRGAPLDAQVRLAARRRRRGAARRPPRAAVSAVADSRGA